MGKVRCRAIELWLHTFAVPHQTADVARRAEAFAADVLPALLAA